MMALSLTGPVQILNQLLGKNSQQNYTFVPTNGLRSTIDLNQLLSGVVKQDLGEGKYIVQFRGEDLIVESKPELKLNDIIYGRVIGIGDKIELQRIVKENESADKQSFIQQKFDFLYSFGKVGQSVSVVLQNYRVSLSKDEQLALIEVLKITTSENTLSLTAVVLKKIGIQVTKDTLNTLYPVLSSELKQKFNLQNIIAEVNFSSKIDSSNKPEVIKELAEFIYTVADKFPNAHAQSSDVDTTNYEKTTGEIRLHIDMDMSSRDEKDKKNHLDPARILLNTQSDSSVSHRVSIVPFMINNELVEVDVALFSQKQGQIQGANNHKRIILSLDMDAIGKLEAEINIIGKHARININTENNLVTNELVNYMPTLSSDFEANDFKIDELSYGAKKSNSVGKVIESVVEHYITQDSLSRLY